MMGTMQILDVSDPVKAISDFLSSRNLLIEDQFHTWSELIHQHIFPELHLTRIQETYKKWYKQGYIRCLRELLFGNQEISLFVFNGCPPFRSIHVKSHRNHSQHQYTILHMPNHALFLLSPMPPFSDRNSITYQNQSEISLAHFSSTNRPDVMPFDDNKDLGMDEILEPLLRLYQDIPSFDDSRYDSRNQEGRKLYTCFPADVLRQKMRQAPDKFKVCRLELEGCNLGYAYPVNYGDRHRHPRITLVGRLNCGRAAAGDTVCVELFDRPNPESEFYGCVIGVLQATLKRNSSLAPCTYNNSSAQPLFPGVPMLNFPRMENSQVRQQYDNEIGAQARNIIDSRRQLGMLTAQDRALISSEEAQRRSVCLYRPVRENNSIQFGHFSPRLIPTSRNDSKYFILVHQEMWNPHCKYPLGRPVTRLVYPNTVADTIPLMRLFYQMPLPSSCELLSQTVRNRCKTIQNQYEGNKKSRVNWSSHKTTIVLDYCDAGDSPSRDCDQAISVFTLTRERCYEVAFHICDVAEVIAADSDLDRQARHTLSSVRERSEHGLTSSYLFPTHLTAEALAFKPHANRFALTALFYFTYDGELMDSPPESVTIAGASRQDILRGMLFTLVRPQYQMSASDMAAYCRDSTPSTQRELTLVLKNLCNFARFLRQRRLPVNSAFSLPVVDKSNFLEPPMDIEFQFIREEFVWLVNQRMFHMLRASSLRPLIPVHIMQRPPAEDIQNFINRFKNHIESSPLLQQRLVAITGPEALRDLNTNSSKKRDLRVTIPWQLIQKLTEIVRNGTYSSAARILAVEELLPGVQLVLHHLNWLRSARDWSLYESVSETDDPIVQLDACEPLKNYLHLFVQRCLKMVMTGPSHTVQISNAPLQQRQLWNLVRECSHIDSRFTTFGHACERTFLARQCIHEPIVIQATVVECNPQEIILNHPFLDVTANGQAFGNEGQHLSANDLRIHESEILSESRRNNNRNGNAPAAQGDGRDTEMAVFSWIGRIYSASERNTGRRDDRLLRLNMDHMIYNTNNPVALRSEFQRGDHLFLPPQSSHLQQMIHTFSSGISSGSANESRNVVNDVLSEYDIPNRVQWLEQMTKSPVVEFEARICPGDTLLLQYGCSQSSPTQSEILSTRIHYVNLTPSFGLCVEHKRYPDKCFLCSPLKRIPAVFRNIEEYVESHLLVTRNESLYQATNEMISNRLVDVPVHWFYFNNPDSYSEEENAGRSHSETKQPLTGIFFVRDNFAKERFLPFYCPPHLQSDDLKAVLAKACRSLQTLFYVCVTTTMNTDVTPKELMSAPKWIAHGFVNHISRVNARSTSFHKYLLRSKILTQEDIDCMQSNAEDDHILACSFVVTSSLSQVNVPHLRNECSIEFIRNPPSSWTVEKALSKLVGLPPDHLAVQLALELREDQVEHPLFAGNREEYIDSLIYQMQFHLRRADFQLNDNQCQAVTRALLNRASLIFGPPGTGKSTVIACLALAYFLRNRGLQQPQTEENPKKRTLLIVAPSNTAADVVTEAVVKLFQRVFGPSKQTYTLFRIYGNSLQMEDFPIPGVRWNYYNSLQRGLVVPQSLRDVALHHAARRLEPSLENEFRNIRLPNDVYAFQKHQREVFERLVRSADILCGTTVTCSQEWLSGACDFVQVVIDEAGMCKEGESYLPLLNAPSVENFVLVGDHKQLAPILMSSASVSLGLNVSLFERYSRLWERSRHLTILNTQYRMHPSICEFPSRFTYDDVLTTAPNKKWTGLNKEDIQERCFPFWTGLNSRFVLKPTSRMPIELLPETAWPAIRPPSEPYNIRLNTGQSFPSHIPQHPPEGVHEHIVFIHIENGNEITNTHAAREMGQKSKANMKEADEAFRIYQRLAENARRSRVPPDVIVLSQYRYQVHVINEKIKRVYSNFMDNGAKAISVNSSQGMEWDYVIFSTVRSQPLYNIEPNPSPGWQRKHLGFITDQNQVNVAITRARKGLIIIGNANLLKLNETWRALIQNLQDRGCFINGAGQFWAS